MRYLLFILMAAQICFGQGFWQPRIGGTNLVAWWTFNEGSGIVANDYSGGASTLSGSNSPAWVAGVVGTAFLESVTNYWNRTNNFTALDNSDKTLSCWINPTVTNVLMGIVDKDADALGGWGFWFDSTGVLNYWPASGKNILDSGATRISPGKWQHIAIEWSHSGQWSSFYINGVFNSMVTNATATETAAPAGTFLQVGNLRNNLGSGTFSLRGSIDDARLFNRILSSVEISQLYNSGHSTQQ